MNREPIKITISSTGISLGATEAQPGDTLEFIALGDDSPRSVTVSLIDGGRGVMDTNPPSTGGKDFQVDLSGFSTTYIVPGGTTVPDLAPCGSYKLAAGRHDATLKVVNLARSSVGAPSGAPRRLALLIGIDRYEPEASSLSGCVNDVDAIEDVLLDALKMRPTSIRKLASRHPGSTRVPRVSPEKLPTRQNICDALSTLAKDAQKGDIVFIYYSGHGTQYTDGTSSIEGMVPMDSATPLWDFDFTPLLTSIATKCGDLTVVLDCCHSGGVPRDIKLAKRSLPFEGPHPTAPGAGSRGGPRVAAGPEMLVIAACQSEQSAFESPAGEPGAHGVLTRMLLAAFEKAKGSPLSSLRWAEVWESVRAAILDTKSPQSPLLLGRAERPVFGGAWTPQSDGWPVLRKGDKYTLRAGVMVGITEGATLEVYVGNARLGELVVSSAELASSVAVLSQGDAAAFPEAGMIARLIKRVEDEKLVVKLDPWNEALAKDLVDRASVRVTKGGVKELPWECVIGVSSDGKHVAADGTNQLWLGDEIHGERAGMEPPLAYVDAGDWSALAAAVHHFEDYNQVLRLVRHCKPQDGAPARIALRLIDRGETQLDREKLSNKALLELPHNPESAYTYSASDKRKWRVEVNNLSDERLYVSLFDAGSEGTVRQLAKAVEIPGKQSHAIWADGGRAFRCVTGDRPSTVDRILAVATTNRNADLDGLVLSGTFTQAMDRNARKTVVDDDPAYETWAAAMVTLKTVKST